MYYSQTSHTLNMMLFSQNLQKLSLCTILPRAWTAIVVENEAILESHRQTVRTMPPWLASDTVVSPRYHVNAMEGAEK